MVDLQRPFPPAFPGSPQYRGFSLLELLIVMAIMLILFIVMYGPSSRGMQEKRKGNCEKNLQNVYVALKTYSLDNNSLFPALANAQSSEPPLSVLVPRYTTGTEYFICPGSSDRPLPQAQPFANDRISYAYYMGRTSNDGADQPLVTDRQVNTLSKTAGQQVFSTTGKKPGNNHNKYGGNVMFCDGSMRETSANAEFSLLIPPPVVLLNPKP